ncbi:MAG: isocitrate/isopropylmalate dehydrogenase family protein [Candidatus Omnitrophota bacterium]|nr:isocitrate/isopropylmalate dehydrogenase family protein [Candidatus Omnitrophota bacterium]
MKKYKVTLIPGDGIGPEVAYAAKDCVDATGVNIDWEEVVCGEAAIKDFGTPLPEAVLDSIRKNKVALKGPITTPVGSGFRSVNVGLRQALDLYACLRPAKYYEGAQTRYRDVDLVIVRENSEDLYAGIEFAEGAADTKAIITAINEKSVKKIRGDSGVSIKPISKFASKRIVRFAFEYALKNKRKKVTCVHKANIMKFTDGLFLSCAREVASEYAGKIEFNDAIVDNLSMQLVKAPHNFDVLVLPNLYGDIISDLCAGLIGGLGIAPGANIGEGMAIFEPVHGSAPKYAGLNKVNPTATILSGVLMLKYLGEEKTAERLENAVRDVIKEGKFVTYDFRLRKDEPSVGTREMAAAIIEKLK